MAGRGRGRGGGGRGGGRGGPPTTATSFKLPTSHVEALGVKRPNFGQVGKALTIQVNSFKTTIPDGIIHHYDVISPSEKTLPARLNLEIIDHLQRNVEPGVFTPRAVYDGRKNLFAYRLLPDFILDAEKPYREFNVPIGEAQNGKAPKVYKVKLTKVAEINPETLRRFIAGDQSHDNSVLTAITALNVVVRMQPNLDWPFNIRSFFTDTEKKNIGGGLELWRGYFQSVRPGMGKMLINIDISTGTMYKSGPLISLCLEFLNRGNNPNFLAPSQGLPDRVRLQLQRFISGIRVLTPAPDGRKITRVVKKLSAAGASSLSFSLRDGGTMTVAQYFQKVQNRPLQHPTIMCAEVGSGALIPLELCEVPKGQIIRKQVPPEKTRDVLEFATKRPLDRLNSIRNGIQVLAYGQSEYVRQFGMAVDTASGPLKLQARVLTAPTLKYGPGSKSLMIQPQNGSWNMVDKKFFRPVGKIEPWVVVVYEREARFNQNAANDMVAGLRSACAAVGIGLSPPTVLRHQNAQGDVQAQLREAGKMCHEKSGKLPMLIVAVIPEGGNDTYTAIKHFGDVAVGVATQCLKSSKCFKAKPQYYANVCLKINVKLGGINLIPAPESVRALTDPQNPTVLMGADVIHPAPGSEGRPSFTSLVANVDSDAAKYVAASRVQTSRQEMIDDMKDMAKSLLSKYVGYRQNVEKKSAALLHPKRIIVYRDGVSEGQFAQVLSQELPLLKEACKELGMNPKFTVIVVGKRHHVRFFPQTERDADRSGNCPAGTVVDTEICSPLSFDFFLQSHGGLLGTSRPAHYSVLYDENNFVADDLQALSFALCHVYARSTRSVSIPAPVYYADIVCSRAKNHYDPNGTVNFSESATDIGSTQADNTLDAFRRGFKPLHPNQEKNMYFS